MTWLRPDPPSAHFGIHADGTVHLLPDMRWTTLSAEPDLTETEAIVAKHLNPSPYAAFLPAWMARPPAVDPASLPADLAPPKTDNEWRADDAVPDIYPGVIDRVVMDITDKVTAAREDGLLDGLELAIQHLEARANATGDTMERNYLSDSIRFLRELHTNGHNMRELRR